MKTGKSKAKRPSAAARPRKRSSAGVRPKEILEFLLVNQNFSKLYNKFPGLRKQDVKRLLLELSKRFVSRTIIDCYVDGAAQPNPGPAGAGAVIYRNSAKVKEISKFLGCRTNNQAEYEALDIALGEVLKILEENSAVSFFSDSLLLVNQVGGLWRVKDSGIAVLLAKVKKKLKRISSKKSVTFRIEHINRDKNRVADSLSVLAIRQKS